MTRTAVPLTTHLSYCDLNFLGLPNTIATAILNAPGGVALVDPGPSTCLESLELALQGEGIAWRDVTTILLTHIHLDHAGATGTIVGRHPRIEVFVHERGARHLTAPGQLVESASRYFGPVNMQRFWGEVVPVPRDRLRVLAGGETVDAGGRPFEVVYTPGHAHHHVSYFDPSSGIAFVGDVAGMCVKGGPVVPPTPPPDFDVELWMRSIEQIGALRPQTVLLTHFGPVETVQPHLQTLAENLRWMVSLVQDSLAIEAADAERSQAFGERLRRELFRAADADHIPAYEPTAALETLWFGIARYLRKR
jgi:glyoxylase-like metal-dependent hydrolase (beta-lactamase superfamily II)